MEKTLMFYQQGCKPMMIYPYKEILLRNKRRHELLIHTIMWVNLKIIAPVKEARKKEYLL